ncbi:MAG TPA: aminotransferase class V-fold PLP-dependent enzyme [Bacteroidia bacterium]
MNKREFIKNCSLGAMALPLSPLIKTVEKTVLPDFGKTIDWDKVREQYQLDERYINLENGYYNILPKYTLEAQIKHLNDLNVGGSYYMRNDMMEGRRSARQYLADFLECPIDNIIITRNTTESLNSVICGIDWKKGDEAIMANQEYGAMLDMFKQQSKRYGMVNKFIDLPISPTSDEEIVDLYRKQINSHTRIILLSHIVNITGQILPVRKICDMAHQNGVKVLVDGAHAIGHFQFNLTELNCDYYGSSLHKWLSAPLGVGLLYVKSEHIESLWPLFGESAYDNKHVLKLNHSGTIPLHIEMSIADAIDFYKQIGAENKENRLRTLKNYWVEKVKNNPSIYFNTPNDTSRSCAIANVGHTSKKPQELAAYLLKEHKIWTVAIDAAGVRGCRITPNVFNTFKELDKFADALNHL